MTTAKKSVLIIGNSHIECIIDAHSQAPDDGISFVNLRPIGKCSNSQEVRKIIELCPSTPPDILILCIRGNLHNGTGLYEHARPFALGNMDIIEYPAATNRTIIPYSVMYQNFELSYNFAALTELIDQFDRSEKFYLIPPPPVTIDPLNPLDPTKFRRRIREALKAREHLGFSSNPLRLALFNIERDVIRDNMERLGVSLIEPPKEAISKDGFLLPKFFDADDPIHGNVKYGQLLLQKIDWHRGFSAT